MIPLEPNIRCHMSQVIKVTQLVIGTQNVTYFDLQQVSLYSMGLYNTYFPSFHCFKAFKVAVVVAFFQNHIQSIKRILITLTWKLAKGSINLQVMLHKNFWLYHQYTNKPISIILTYFGSVFNYLFYTNWAPLALLVFKIWSV